MFAVLQGLRNPDGIHAPVALPVERLQHGRVQGIVPSRPRNHHALHRQGEELENAGLQVTADGRGPYVQHSTAEYRQRTTR